MTNVNLTAFDASIVKCNSFLKPLLINEQDLNKYMIERDSAQYSNIKPADHFLNDLIKFFNSDNTQVGSSLPWSKADDLIRLRPSELTVWAGFNGHGKSLLLGQVILHLLKDQRACIASFEMRPVTTLSRMCRQALGAKDPTDEYIRRFCERAGDKLWFYDQQSTVSTEQVIKVIHYASEKLQVQHFVIDSLMKCGLAEDDYTGQKRFIDKLCAIAKDTGCHIHLVAHSRKGQDEFSIPNKMDIKGSGSITDQADNVMTVWRNKRKEQSLASGKTDAALSNESDALILCDKQRNGEWEGKIGLWFDKVSFRLVEKGSAIHPSHFV